MNTRIRLLALVLVALIGMPACSPTLILLASKPSVVLAAPPHGSEFREGENVVVQSVSTDTAGIARVELLVDGALVRSDAPPGLQTSFSVAQNWTATRGTHTIAVRAANAAGAPSDLAAISITVLAPTALASSPVPAAPPPVAVANSPTAPPRLGPTAAPGTTAMQPTRVPGSSTAIPSRSPTPAGGLVPSSDFPPPPIAPVPKSAAEFGGARYAVYQYPGDSFRFLCQEPCPLDERLVFAGYQGWKARKEHLVRYTGIDVPPELAPVDIHLTVDPECVYRQGTLGTSSTYTVDGRLRGLICLWVDLVRDSDLRFPLTPETAVKLGGLGVVLHEYSHVLFFRRHENSSHDYVFPIEYNIPIPVSTVERERNLGAYRDPCSQSTGNFSRLFYTLCQQNRFRYDLLAPSLIELDRLFQAGLGDRKDKYGQPTTSANQYRAILNALVGSDTLSAFVAAGMLKNDAGPAPAIPSEGACTNQAALAADVTVPLGTLIDAGAAFAKTWRVRNSGTCAWGSGYQLAFYGGEALTASTAVAIPAAAPGATVDLTVPMVAPAAPGVHTSQWRLRNANGASFGPIINQTIYVRPGCSVPPSISTFTVSPATISRGAEVTFSWGQVTNVDSLEITPAVGRVDMNGGSANTAPQATTTYALVAHCGSNTAQKQVTVPVFETAPGFAVTGVTASAGKSAYSGQCPHLVEFSAVITTNGAGTVGFFWERNDGPTTATQYVTFDAAGSKTITRERTMAMSWWERVRILSPNSLVSNQVDVSITCGR